MALPKRIAEKTLSCLSAGCGRAKWLLLRAHPKTAQGPKSTRLQRRLTVSKEFSEKEILEQAEGTRKKLPT